MRSLMISQRLLGTRKVVLVHHTDCGMARFKDEELADAVEADTGFRPPFSLGAYTDVAESVRAAARLLAESPFVVADEVVGFVFDVETGGLITVDL